MRFFEKKHDDSMIRVLHVLPWIARGGVERRRVSLARGLGEPFEQQIACMAATGDVHEQLKQLGVPIHQLGRPGRGITDVMAHLRLHRLVRRFRPHILHGAIFEGMVWGGLAGLAHGVPVVLLEETSYPNHTAPASMRRSVRGRAIVRAIARRSAGVVAVAPQIARYLRSEVGLSASLVHVILNGVARIEIPAPDAIRVERLRLGLPSTAFVLGGVGRIFEEHKRFADLLRCVASARRLGDVRALIVGDGPDLPGLKTLAHELGIADAVVFTGRREDRDLFFGVMDAFVLSSATEAAPLALMEAMMAGKPCVATTVGGVVDIATDEVNALLVQAGNLTELGRAIQRLIEEPGLRGTLARSARIHALEFFTVERYVDEVRALYLAKITEKVGEFARTDLGSHAIKV